MKINKKSGNEGRGGNKVKYGMPYFVRLNKMKFSQILYTSLLEAFIITKFQNYFL